MNRTRRCFAVLFATVLLPFGATAQDASLREVYKEHFTFGVGLGGWPRDLSPAELALVRGQFATITPANAMKMHVTQPSEGNFAFDHADAVVAFAQANNMGVAGHCLLWANDDNTPEWMLKEGEATVSRETLLRRLRSHIETVAGRYKGKVVSWDVVNEALGDGDVYLRESTWLEVAGESFIAEAFRIAHEVDPNALLIYNDYNLFMPQKREKAVRLLSGLLEQGVPVHAVGMQGHWQIDEFPMDGIEATIVALKELGLKVLVAELDMDMIPRNRWWADGGAHREALAKLDPYPDACPPELLARQAEQYKALFALFLRHADALERVTFWNLHDGRSWLNSFPWTRSNHPLLWDRDAQPKPAFQAVIDAGTGR